MTSVERAMRGRRVSGRMVGLFRVKEIEEGKVRGGEEEVLGINRTVCDGNSGYVTRKRRWFIREWRS